MTQGKYYWKFKQVIPEVLSEQRECVVCGSKKNLNVHHIVHCRSYEKRYADKNNLVVLCRDCHREYHNSFSKSTPVTLFKFMRNKYLIEQSKYESLIKDLQHELLDYKDLVNYIIQMQ